MTKYIPLQSRRNFLKLSSACLAGLAASGLEKYQTGFVKIHPGEDWPSNNPTIRTGAQTLTSPNIAIHTLSLVKHVLEKVPTLSITSQGFLECYTNGGVSAQMMPLAPTLWNQENSQPDDRLSESLPWAIVLHWYGDRDGVYQTLGNYLHGFNSYRLVNQPPALLPSRHAPPGNLLVGSTTQLDKENSELLLDRYRTSAHFLVGKDDPLSNQGGLDEPLAIVQTQVPDQDGTPFRAAHVGPLDSQQTYFVQALKKLQSLAPDADFALLDFYRRTRPAVNQRTIGIEVSGYNFDAPGQLPPAQQLANLLGVICAVMKRYHIQAHNILGHHELQTGKADPGKKFLALMRYLVAVKALMDGDPHLQELVFAPFASSNVSQSQAVQTYFKHLRQYLVLVSSPLVVYEWEKLGNYWLFYPLLSADSSGPKPVSSWVAPLQGKIQTGGLSFLSPSFHEGLDLYPQALFDRRGSAGASATVRLIADGECLYSGPYSGAHGGLSSVFRHTQADGTRVISVYGNLQRLFELQTGRLYPTGYPLGLIIKEHNWHNPFLHLAIACDTLWEDGLGQQATLPLNAGSSWIQQRYLDPLGFLQERAILD
jgi:hypothetical protein